MNAVPFQAERARDGLVEALRRHARDEGYEHVVLGISGGKDSTVAAALCARALGPGHVLGVLMPDGEQKDLADSLAVVRALSLPYRILNIGGMHRALLDEIQAEPPEGQRLIPFSRPSDINVGPRLRMTALRYVAQATGARLVGTGNLSEITVGYCTKDGDTSADVQLLAALTSVEVVEVGLSMPEIPRHLVTKPPADGLSGLSDEENMGLSYRDIHAYIRLGTSGDAETDRAIAARSAASRHKRVRPPVLSPGV